MLTILSNLIFWPALIFNLVFWTVICNIVFFDSSPTRTTPKDVGFMILVLALMIVPGVYLFGIW